MSTELPEIVRRAIVETVTDVGQLSKSEIYQLNKYVKRGWLSRGKGGPYPILKTVYAHRDFDFDAARQAYVDEAVVAYEIEKRLRASGYFDMNSPNYGVDLAEQRKDEEQMSTTKATTEFDRVFEDLEAPDYPATCDQCGAEGTNASMAGHECFVTRCVCEVLSKTGLCEHLSNKPPAPRAGKRDEWRVFKHHRKRILNATGILVAEAQTEEQAAQVATEHNQHVTLVEQRERLQLAAIRTAERLADLPRYLSVNGMGTMGSIVADCLEELRLATIEQEGEA